MTRRRWSWAGLATTPAGLAVAAVVVGVGAGAGAVVFRYLIYGVTLLATGQQDYAATPGAPWRWWPAVGPWFLLVVPVLGGLLYGPLVYRWAREARGHGVPEVMYAVAENGGRIRPAGRGGEVAGVGAVYRLRRLRGPGGADRADRLSTGLELRPSGQVPDSRLRLLVACGAAGGIAATFNAPIAGVFFALELILSTFAADASAWWCCPRSPHP